MINFSLMKPISTASATMTTSTGSPRRSRLGIEVSPVPMDVAAVTSFFFVRSSSRGISSRYAAVKAPEVMTRMSFVIVFMVVLFSSAVLFIPKACESQSVQDSGQTTGFWPGLFKNNGRGANLSGVGQWACPDQACKRKCGANCDTKASRQPSTTQVSMLHASVPASSEAHSSAYSVSPLFPPCVNYPG